MDVNRLVKIGRRDHGLRAVGAATLADAGNLVILGAALEEPGHDCVNVRGFLDRAAQDRADYVAGLQVGQFAKPIQLDRDDWTPRAPLASLNFRATSLVTGISTARKALETSGLGRVDFLAALAITSVGKTVTAPAKGAEIANIRERAVPSCLARIFI